MKEKITNLRICAGESVKRGVALLSFCIISLLLSAQTTPDIFNVKSLRHVSVHDPSVVVGFSKAGKVTGDSVAGALKTYFIFGSHRAWARSTDLKNWTTFTNNINSSYKTMFANAAKWSARGGTQNSATGSYDVTGNLWAPDVVWNKHMKKWCMYMSVNGDNYYSSIVMLTADNLTGNWTYVGPVVYSGFMTAEEAQATDFYQVHEGTDLPVRYTWRGRYSLNAIDPCVFYDEDGNLWMTYGSWFGGIYMLRLDAETGLRDYNYHYDTTDGTSAGAVSDEYLGLKLAGGNGASGEGSYVKHIGDRYYLFLSYGGFASDGGYSMRVFSSTDVKGPYRDLSGQDARYSSGNTQVGNVTASVGSRLMSYYCWDALGYGYIAQGHNSALVDTDGRAFLVYHTRFTNAGEGHEVRVHQLFQAANGGLVASPFEYTGEATPRTPYSVDDIVGDYNIIYHMSTDYAKKVCRTEGKLKLNADGTISGQYTGTWQQAEDGPYLTLKIGSSLTMQGVLLKQKMEGLNHETMCFSVIGNSDIPIWGYKSADDAIAEALSEAHSLPISDGAVVANYATGTAFNKASASTAITAETGLSLSFFVSGLTSDWDLVGTSTDDSYHLLLSVLHYNGCDFFEAAATVDAKSPVKTNLHTAFLNGSYYVTVSFNPDGTIAYYRNGTLLFTYQANLTPSYGTGVTPADIVKAVINYYRTNKFDFSRTVYGVTVGYSVQYDREQITGISDVEREVAGNDSPSVLYNLAGQRVGANYRGIVIKNGKKVFKKQ